jgi:hypothetical protein
LGLVAVVLASLVFSDWVAMRHVGNCCRDDRSMAAVQADRAEPGEVCSHHGCDHGNPFRRHLAGLLAEGGANTVDSDECDSVAISEDAPCPCPPPHDRDRCAVCRWFVVISSGVNFDAPVSFQCGEVVSQPVLASAGLPAVMLFLPTVSRRGPPIVA